MKGDITLSPKHGVNPSMGVCYFCGEPDGTIILPGKLKPYRYTARGERVESVDPDPQAPRYAVWTREPCEKCKGIMKRGVFVIEVVESDPTPGQEPTRTGRIAVVIDDAVRRLPVTPALRDHILEKRVVFMPKEVSEKFGLFEIQPTEEWPK